MLKNIEELIYIDKEITQKKLLTTQRKENPQNEPEVLEHLLFQEEHIDHIYNALKKYLEACTKNSIDTFYQEAARGEPLAQLFIGQYKLASKDMTERQAGEKFLLRVANNPATEFAIKAQLILGDYYHNNKKQKQAIAQYRKAANKGKVKAIYKLGEIFYEKDKTKEKGLKYFRQAAYKGSIQAIEKLIQIKDGKVEKWEERLQNLQKAKTEKPFEHLFSKLIRKRVLKDPKTLIPETEKKMVFILSVAGGGIRGIIPATILRELEEKLAHNTFYSKTHLAQYFDLMAGTSTGGIIILGLNVKDDKTLQLHSAEDLLNLYSKNGRKIFPNIAWYKRWAWKLQSYVRYKYNPAPLEEVLENHFERAELKDTYTKVIVPAYSMERNSPFLFDSTEAKQNPRSNFLIKDVARATAAAPTYFSLPKITDMTGTDKYTFADGGVWANDPTFEAIQRAMELYPNARKYFIVSVGTGSASKKLYGENFRNIGQYQFVRETENFLFKAMEQARDWHLQHVIRDNQKFLYYHFNPDIAEANAAMDNADHLNLAQLKARAQAYVTKKESQEIINTIAIHLLEAHKENQLFSYRAIMNRRGYIEPAEVPYKELFMHRISKDHQWQAIALTGGAALGGAAYYFAHHKPGIIQNIWSSFIKYGRK